MIDNMPVIYILLAEKHNPKEKYKLSASLPSFDDGNDITAIWIMAVMLKACIFFIFFSYIRISYMRTNLCFFI